MREKLIAAVLSMLVVGGIFGGSIASASAVVLGRGAWEFDRSVLDWYKGESLEKAKERGRFDKLAGWVEYDFEVTEPGWYELWQIGVPSEWSRDIFLDGKIVSRLHISSSKRDVIVRGDRRGWCKELNLFLDKGKHSLRYRRLSFPGVLPNRWELIKADGNPFGCLRAKVMGQNVLRAGEKIKLKVIGGMAKTPSSYDLVVQNEVSEELTPVGTVQFPASDTPITKTVDITFPAQGSFRILAKQGETLSRPADLNAGLIVAIDVKNPPVPAKTLQKSLVVDIDCTAERKDGFWEKDGKTSIVETTFCKYRESSGNASNHHWGLDGFSYSFDLPDKTSLYQLVVDYPDDDRRSMGFWINDGVTRPKGGYTLTGGVETGDRYVLSNQMQRHEAFFFPRGNKDLIVAVLNLTHGTRAAAARIRIYRVDGNLPAANIKKSTASTPDRAVGYYFEESGRWIRHFGGGVSKTPLEDQIKTMERWGQWNRYIGANLMFPTINVYQANHYPSNILEGYFNRTIDECRMNAFVAEKYDCQYIPEFHLSGQTWFEKQVMGVWMSKKTNRKKDRLLGIKKKKDAPKPVVMFRDQAAKERVLVSMDGKYHCSWKPFVYNALHSEVQEMYISVLGELADRLADTESFAGISSRLMLGWQWMGWNALPGLKWGYGDWTIRQFEKETGIKVPGGTGDDRFQKRFAYLTTEKRTEWVTWRCDKMLDYYRRIRNRIQQAKPSAKLILPWHGPDKRAVLSNETLAQMEECGIRWKDFISEPGMMIIPGAVYGRRYSTPILDAGKEDKIYDANFKQLCQLGDRGAMLYSDYFEVNRNLKWEELGGQPYGAFDCNTPGGINERELYALFMADSDCSLIVNGGNGWFFGTPDVLSPFIKEYRALPAKQFTKSEKFNDPVALWHRQEKDDFYFYAVNRLPYPVQVKVELDKAGNVVLAASGEIIREGWRKGRRSVTFELPAFMLKSFRVEGSAVAVDNLTVDLDEKEIEALKPMIAFAAELLADLQHRRVAIELSRAEAEQAIKQLKESVQAFKEKRYWAAKSNLRRLNMIRIYDMIGQYPPGLHERKHPRGFTEAKQAPQLTFAREADIIGDVRGRLSSITDLCLDAQGNLYAASPEQIMSFLPDGQYLQSHRLVSPHTPDRGGIRHGGLAAPRYQGVSQLSILDDGCLGALFYNTSLNCYDVDDSRLATQISMPGRDSRQLTVGRDGSIYIGCTSPADKVGIWKYRANGQPAYDYMTDAGEKSNRLPGAHPGPLAVDGNGNIYVGLGTQVQIYSAAGKQLDSVSDIRLYRGIGALAVTRSGNKLFVASAGSGELHSYSKVTGGKFARQQKIPAQGGGVTALVVSKSDRELIIGYKQSAAGAIAVKRAIGNQGLGQPVTMIKALEDELNCLQGVSQIKAFGNALYFLNGNRLMKVRPGSNRAVLAHAFDVTRTKIEAFAFTPQGDLYLASNSGFYKHSRGTNVYLAKKLATGGWGKPEMINASKPLTNNPYYTPADMAVDGEGNLLIRHFTKEDKDPNHMTIYKRLPGGKLEKFGRLGPQAHGTVPGYGIHVSQTTGKIYVAGGSSRTIACYSVAGQEEWRVAFDLPQGPASVPIRNTAGITTDSRENVWVTDPAANRILCFDKNGRFLKRYGHFGTIDDRDGESFCNPVGIATAQDKQGREWLYVTDVNNQRIKKFLITMP